MLAARVAAGQLPPVAERLPDDMLVITPTDTSGLYGATWHTVTWWEGAGNIKLILYDPPVRWRADYSGYEEGLLTEMPLWSADGKIITFTFRSGIKWSDGAPFTTADLQFWWEDMALNPECSKTQVPWWARNSDGTAITMTFPSTTTWALQFDTAQYIMPYVLAQGYWEWEALMKPAHFLKQWHPDYDGQAGTVGYAELEAMDDWFATPGYPCLMAWCLNEYLPGQSWLFERNPYYWKVDSEGRQLPYIDYIHVNLEPDADVRAQQAAQGHYDCTFRGISDASQRALLLANASSGDYRLVPGWMAGTGAWPGFIVNQDYHRDLDYDPVTEAEIDVEIRELLRNKFFRQGLSHALHRQRILDEVWAGVGEIKQFTISPQSPHFVSPTGQALLDSWANSYKTYSPTVATSLWDGIGFMDTNSDSWRDLPSGKSFTLTVDLNDWGGAEINAQAVEIFRQNLEAVGVRVVINDVISDPQGDIRGNHGLYMLRTAQASDLDLWTYPDWVFPLRGGGEGTRAFPMQGLWYQTGGAEGWHPPPGSPADLLQDIYRQGLQQPDLQTRDTLVWDAINIHIDEGPFVIGATGDQSELVVCKTYFNNVLEYGVLGPWAPASPGNVYPEQFWMGYQVPVTPGVSSTLTLTDSQETAISIVIPQSGVAEPVTLAYTPVSYLWQGLPAGDTFAGLAFDLNAYGGTLLQTGFQFTAPVNVTLIYSDSLVAGVDETALTLNYWDETAEVWKDAATTCVPQSTYTRVPAENRLSVDICHLSYFALLAPGHRIYLPLVLRYL
ncbi:MAG: hypothetical protein JXR84_29005 [Anaerolineae bacterium]|nr:hypothetical protein [Anaerolineae bacterium]